MFRALFETALDPILIADDDGIYVDANPAACELLDITHEALIGRSVLRDSGASSDSWAAFLSAGTRKGEFVFRRQDGTELILEYAARANVVPGRHIAILRDATEKRRAEELHRHSEELFAAAFHLSPIAKAIVALPGRHIIDVNSATTALTGYTHEEMVGRTAEELRLWVDRDHSEKVTAAVKRGAGLLHEYPCRLHRKDGEIRDILMSLQYVKIQGDERLLGVYVDVTDLKHAEREIAAYQTLLEESQRLSRIGSWSSTLDLDKPLRISREVYRLLGVDPVPLTITQFLSYVHPDDRHLILDAHASRSTAGLEYRIVRPDGELRWVRVALDNNTDGDELLGFIGTIQDITETMLAELARRESEARYRRIVETAAEGMVIIDPHARVTMVNAQMCAMLGLDEPEIVGREMFERIAPRCHRLTREQLEQRRRGCRASYDVTLLRCDGSELIAQVHASPLFDANGTYEGSLGMFTDVTERRRAEEGRRQLAAIVESANDAIASTDSSGRFTSWNAAAERLYGYSREEVQELRCEELVPPELREEAARASVRALAGERVALQTRRRRKKGTDVEVLLTYSRLATADDTPTGVSLIAHDLTEQRRLERSLQQTEQQLRHLQKMEAIGALAGGVAHDFNNILSVILTCASLLEDMLDHADPAVEEVMQIREAGERAAKLTRQLLAFSRQQVLDLRNVRLDAIFTSMQRMLQRVVGETIRVESFSDPDLGNVLVDPNQFEQVILNLAVNARDAMPDGGSLTLTHQNVELGPNKASEIGAAPGRYVRVAVTDTGVGMSREVRERMFEPFFTTKEMGRGTGLGLATVFGIVKQSGGHIHVLSEPGCGTTIELYFPCVDAICEPKPATTGPLELANQETVLLVEDEELVRRAVHAVLRRLGYNVLVAANAGEAVLLAEQHSKPIHVLLTDLVMPIMNGRQLAERLTAMHAEMKIVFMSGYSADLITGEELAAKAVVFVQKPIRPAVLATKLRDALDRALPS